jgi:hypothetical protein
MKNTEQWLKLALKVAQSYGDGTRSARTDSIDRSIMAKCVRVLLSGRALSPKQRNSFIDSVRLRVDGQYVDREFPERVMLTPRQRQSALRDAGNILTELAACYDRAVDSNTQTPGSTSLVASTVVDSMSLPSEQAVHDSYPACSVHAARLLPTCDERSEKLCGTSALTSLTELNTTEQNGTELPSGMDLRSIRRSLGLSSHGLVASPADEVALVTPPEHPGSPAGSPVVSALRSTGELATHLSSREKMSAPSALPLAMGSSERMQGASITSPRSISRQFEEGRAEPAPENQLALLQAQNKAEPSKALNTEIAPGLDTSRDLEIEVSLWVKDSSLSGELKVGGETYHVNFETYTSCEARMSQSHTRDESPINHDWLSKHMWQTLGRGYRSRQSSVIGKADDADRFAVSGLYSNRKYTGRPLLRVMACACWEDNQLKAIELHNGTDVVSKKMRAYSGSNPKAPSYKQV